MDFLYVIGGILLVVSGIYIITIERKIIRGGKGSKYGADAKMLAASIIAIIAGFMVIAEHL